MNEELEKSKKEILSEARAEAARLLMDTNRQIEKTIKEIRESQADKEKTKEARKELEEVKAKIVSESASQQVNKETDKQINKSTDQRINKSPYNVYLNDLNEKLAHFQLTLDLRGKRVDEAYALIQRYIDDAILLSLSEVRILHGKGTGCCAQVTRDYLKSVKEVRKYRDEVPERGGSGITVVTLK